MVRIGSLLFGYRKGYLGYTAKIPFIFLFFVVCLREVKLFTFSLLLVLQQAACQFVGFPKTLNAVGGFLHLFTSIFTRT